MLLAEAKKDSSLPLKDATGEKSTFHPQPSKLVLDEDDSNSLEDSFSGFYLKSLPRKTSVSSTNSSGFHRLGQRVPSLAKRKPETSQASLEEELKRVASKSFPGIVCANASALPSSLLKESAQSTNIQRKAKVPASNLSSEYVQKLLREASLKDQMEMQQSKSKGLSEGNSGRGVLEKLCELKTMQVRSSLSSSTHSICILFLAGRGSHDVHGSLRHFS